MKRTVLVALLSCVFALTLGLTACGGSGDPIKDSKAAFTGSWALTGMTSDGQETSKDDLELLKSMGLEIELTLNEDESAALTLFGEAVNGTWEPKSAGEATLKIQDQPTKMTIANGTLSMEQNGSKLEFAKKSSASAASASASAASESASAASANAASESANAASASAESASAAASDAASGSSASAS